jgi:hypothetical protein
MRGLLILAALLLSPPQVKAQGTVPIALQTVVDQNGRPIVGAQLYVYQVGTTATRQDSFKDTGLANVQPWPLLSDAYGRIPMFYLANGSVHVTLTDSTGLQIFDYPSMLVVGPSGGGGGGGAVDPSAIASTGDIKFRATGETLSGWVKANGLTIGSAVSGATGRANADTQNLFIYIWNNCLDTFCPVIGGRGASALADFSGNKQISTPDFRARSPFGLADMGSVNSNRLANSLFFLGNATQPGSLGGIGAQTITQAQLPVTSITPSFTGNAVTPTFAGTQQTWSLNQTQIMQTGSFQSGTSGGTTYGNPTQPTVTVTPAGSVSTITPTGSISPVAFGSGAQINAMPPFVLGTWHMKL